MLKNKLLYVGFLGIVLCLLAISALTLSLKAHAAAPAATPTVHAYIVSTKTGVGFKNATIKTVLRNAFAFTNDTGASQNVTSQGKTVATVPAHSSKSYTFSKAGTYTFGLFSNSKATLTVTVK